MAPNGTSIRPEHLVLVWPTETERRQTWTLTHPQWGAALTLDDYLRREEFLLTVPLAKDGGITQWILTDGRLPPDQRPILSSCESILKRALVCRPDGTVVETFAHGVASVFTDPAHRGHGYATRMMTLLGHQLRGWQGRALKAGEEMRTGNVAFSVLYSDIGKEFYARSGWAPFESTHVTFPPAKEVSSAVLDGKTTGAEKNGNATSGDQQVANGKDADMEIAKPVGYHEIAELCAADERNLRSRIGVSRPWTGKTTRVSLIPDLDTMLWHLMREDFMTQHIFGRTPTVRGAVYGAKPHRVWAVWTRGYYGGLEKIEGNTLHILRFAVEDDKAATDEQLLRALKAIIALARREAVEWRAAHVQMWNPVPQLRELVERSGLEHEFVVREKESIASLNWYGEGNVEEVDWVANEKFAWC